MSQSQVIDQNVRTSLINSNAISDSRLLDEVKKYIGAYKGIMSGRLFSLEVGSKSPSYLSTMIYRQKLGHSMAEETRDRLITYLIRKKWFSPAGLPKDFHEGDTPKPESEFILSSALAISAPKEKVDYDGMQDIDLKKALYTWINEPISATRKTMRKDEAAEALASSRSSITQFLTKGQLGKPISANRRKPLIKFLNSKQEEAHAPSPSPEAQQILAQTISTGVERAQVARGEGTELTMDKPLRAHVIAAIMGIDRPEEDRMFLINKFGLLW